jgi:hypothetical protein
MRSLLLALALTIVPAAAFAGDWQFSAGANSTTYDDVPDANSWGVTLRLQYNFSHQSDGWLINLNAPGISLLAGEIAAGYEWKSQGDWYWEGGVGAGYGSIHGPIPLLIAGAGYKVTPNFYLDFPLMFTSTLTWMPYLGFSF